MLSPDIENKKIERNGTVLTNMWDLVHLCHWSMGCILACMQFARFPLAFSFWCREMCVQMYGSSTLCCVNPRLNSDVWRQYICLECFFFSPLTISNSFLWHCDIGWIPPPSTAPFKSHFLLWGKEKRQWMHQTWNSHFVETWTPQTSQIILVLPPPSWMREDRRMGQQTTSDCLWLGKGHPLTLFITTPLWCISSMWLLLEMDRSIWWIQAAHQALVSRWVSRWPPVASKEGKEM